LFVPLAALTWIGATLVVRALDGSGADGSFWAGAGFLRALVGTLALGVGTCALALPLGIGTALWLEQFGRGSRLAKVVSSNLDGLAGVPSVVYGVLGYELFVRVLHVSHPWVIGSCTLALVVLPVVVLSARAGLRSVSPALFEAALALGASRWTVVRHVVLPHAAPGILTGVSLAVSRAVGETAPLLVLGALVAGSGGHSDAQGWLALPVEVFHLLTGTPHPATAAAPTAVVLAALSAALYSTGLIIRHRAERRLTPTQGGRD
jgi:phosphate transport system permease protein